MYFLLSLLSFYYCIIPVFIYMNKIHLTMFHKYFVNKALVKTIKMKVTNGNSKTVISNEMKLSE